MLDVVFEDLERSWAPVHPLKFEYIRSEMNTQFANIATPNEVVVVTTFNIELGNAGGEFHICMPYSMLEPIRDVLFSSLQGEQVDVDKRWVTLLSKQVQAADVELLVNLGRANLTVQEVLNMQPGDVISLDIAKPLVAEVDGVPIMECKCGVFNGQYALKVERLLSPASNDI
jgi:flagellar motor switch protein FliM